MAYAKARRHYRAAQARQAHAKDFFIPKRKRTKVIAFAVIIALAVFVKGVLLGLVLGRE